MTWIVELGIVTCLIIFTGGFTLYWLIKKMHQLDENSGGKKLDGISDRLQTLEKRMNDVQDVVLSLDDRLKVSRDEPHAQVR